MLDAAAILEMRQWVRDVPLADVVKDYAVRLVLFTHPRNEANEGVSALARRCVLYGSSPRGLQSLILAAKARALLAGRPNVSFEDIRTMLLPSLRHRLILNLEADAEGVTAEERFSRKLSRRWRKSNSDEPRVSSFASRAARGQITGFLPRLLRHAVEKLPPSFARKI